MKKSNKIDDITPEARERLKTWLIMRKADSNMKSATTDELEENCSLPEGKTKSFDHLIRAFDNDSDVRQIRILEAGLVPYAGRPYYIAVLGNSGNDRLIIAPFSSFSIPATPGELETERQEFHLSTLQLWNAMEVPAVFVDRGWHVDDLSQSELKDSRAVLDYLTSGKKLPERLKSRVGLPICRIKDPRLEYQREESALLSCLKEKCDRYEKADWKLVSTSLGKVELKKVAGTSALKFTPAAIISKDDHLGLGVKLKMPAKRLIPSFMAQTVGRFSLKYSKGNLPTWSLNYEGISTDSVFKVYSSESGDLLGVGHVIKDGERLFAIMSRFVGKPVIDVPAGKAVILFTS